MRFVAHFAKKYSDKIKETLDLTWLQDGQCHTNTTKIQKKCSWKSFPWPNLTNFGSVCWYANE